MRTLTLPVLVPVPALGAAQEADRRLPTPALPDPTASSGVVADRYPDGRLRLPRSVVEGRSGGPWMEWYPGDGGPAGGEGL